MKIIKNRPNARAIAETFAKNQGINLDSFVKKCMGYGIEKHRVYELICDYIGDFDEVLHHCSVHSAEIMNNGYMESTACDWRIRCIECFPPAKLCYNNTEAAARAEADGIALIPVSELPKDSWLFFDLDRRLIDTPENRKAINRFFEQHSFDSRRNRKYKWIVGICSSDGDHVDIIRVDGTVPQVREYLARCAVEQGREREFDFGTECADDVEIEARDDWWVPTKMYAYASFLDAHVDITATRLGTIEPIDLSKEVVAS